MRVVVTFHDDCREDLRAWIMRLPGTPNDRRALLDVGMTEMKAALAKTGGQPPGVEFHDEPPPPSYWWRFAAGSWVQCTVTRSGWWRPQAHVEVLGLHQNPPF